MVKSKINGIINGKNLFQNCCEKNDANETVVQHIDVSWSLDLLDMIDYGIKNRRGFRHLLLVSENFSEYRFGVPSKKPPEI